MTNTIIKYLTSVYVFASFAIFLNSCAENKGDKMGIQGQFHARVSEGIDMN